MPTRDTGGGIISLGVLDESREVTSRQGFDEVAMLSVEVGKLSVRVAFVDLVTCAPCNEPFGVLHWQDEQARQSDLLTAGLARGGCLSFNVPRETDQALCRMRETHG